MCKCSVRVFERGLEVWVSEEGRGERDRERGSEGKKRLIDGGRVVGWEREREREREITRPVLDRFHDSSRVNALCFMLILYALCFILYDLWSVLYFVHCDKSLEYLRQCPKLWKSAPACARLRPRLPVQAYSYLFCFLCSTKFVSHSTKVWLPFLGGGCKSLSALLLSKRQKDGGRGRERLIERARSN